MSEPAQAAPASARALSQELGPDGVLVVTLDLPGEKVNTLGRPVMEEFDALLTEVESRPEVRGMVLRSGKPDNFIAGADIKDFTTIRSALEGETLARTAQGVIARLESARVPVVAAIHGSCVGGGLETVLCCRYRVASDDPKTGLGVPEVNLGIIPGMGGTQRLPRLVGLAAALDLILTGRTVKATRARRMGLVDEVVPQAALLTAARRAALDLAEGKRRPERPGIPLRERLTRPVIFSKARSMVMARTQGHYPAPLAAIEAVQRGTATSLAEGLKIEARLFGELAVSEASRNLVTVFFATQEIKKDAGYPEGTKAKDVRKLAVLGAGLMGSGIATVSVEAGVDVRIKDASWEAVGRGLRHTWEVLDERRRRRSLKPREVEQRMQRLSPTIDYTGFRRADLVIEAVFEDLDLKRRVLAETEAVIAEDAVFASNTSSLPIGDIARGARHPNRVLGMHFFSPVEKMPLLEVVVTPETDAWATATAVAFGRRIGKHVIVVRDGAGFYTSRALGPYMNEAARLVEEGAAIEAVDRAMIEFGFPVGPLALMDEVGIDVAAKVAKILMHAFGERMAPPASMTAVVEDGRLGRKNRRGFYVYDGKKVPDQSVYARLPSGAPRRTFDVRDIQDRLVFAFLNEAARCLEEGILRSPRDGDVGAIFGLGFPAFRGGPFRYLDKLGARFATEVLERLATHHGERFRPTKILVDHARRGAPFHDQRTRIAP